jgi:hypothetical protein
MNNFNIKGSVYEVCDEQSFSEKFKKRDLIIEVEDGAYKQILKFQLINERCDLADKLRAGQDVEVSFNLQGREYSKDGKTSYFTNLTAWRVKKVGDSEAPAPTENRPTLEEVVKVFDDDEGLPF